MRFRIFKVLSFGSLAAVIVMMMAATVLEKLQGTSAALRLVYHSPVFIALWAVCAGAGLVWLLSRGVAKRRATLLLHLALVLILAGALVTHLTGVQGRVHLRVGESAETFFDANGREHPLPFWWLQLDDFKVEYYDGSAQAADYVSKLTFGDGKLVDSRTVSMNRIFRWFGYRFYQSSFNIIHHSLEPRTVKVHAGITVIDVKLIRNKAVFFCIFLQNILLIFYTIAFAGRIILLRKTAV